MTIRAVFFDLGGVILRTEYQAPRQRLAERLNMTYEDLVRLVFENKSSQQASIGAISPEQHWDEVLRLMHLPADQKDIVRNEFFGGDLLDVNLVDFIRSLRPGVKTGLISNAWLDLRDYITSQHFEDAFDEMIISAEVGVMKPDAGIYQMALESVGVSPNEAVFVDDTVRNVEGAKAVGMHGIQFKQPEEAIEEIKQILNHK